MIRGRKIALINSPFVLHKRDYCPLRSARCAHFGSVELTERIVDVNRLAANTFRRSPLCAVGAKSARLAANREPTGRASVSPRVEGELKKEGRCRCLGRLAEGAGVSVGWLKLPKAVQWLTPAAEFVFL